MSNPDELYESISTNLKVPTDSNILRALKDVCKLGELNISGVSVTTQTCEILCKVLVQSKNITKLNLSDCLLPPQGLAVLLSTMHMTSIYSLQLRGNNIAGPSVSKLSKMLSRSVNIKNLGLEWNNLGLCYEGLTQFCNALGANHSLEVLDLRNNQLDEGCASLIAGALRKNTALRALDVRWNSVEQTGGQYILAALQTNKTLTTLKLQGNSISNDLLTAIEQSIQHNIRLLQLESGYEARKEVLANYVQAINNQRAQDLRDWADKSQRQVNEMDSKMKDVQGLLASKQNQLEVLERVVSERHREIEAVQDQVRKLQEELSLRENSHAAVVRDYQLQIDICNKALSDNKLSLSKLEEKLKDERELKEAVEKELAKEKEKIRHLEIDIEKRKEELQTTITDHIGAVEQERSLSQQRLALAREEWRGHLEQSAAEHSRAEQVYRDKVRALEAALEGAEQTRAELGARCAADRAKWAEEKATILAEFKEKETCKVLLLTEKVEHLKEEKSSLETQLSVANTTVQQLHRDNSVVVTDLADLRRKLSTVQEELSSERLMSQKLRSEKTEDLRVLDSVRNELANAQKNITEMSSQKNDLQREVHRLTDKLEDKERLMSAIRKEEKDRAGLLVAAIKNYVDQINCNSH